MSNPKGLKTWRRTSLASTLSDTEVQKRDRAYLEWLARDRGWLTDSAPCSECNGTGTSIRYSYRRHARQCHWCDGTGYRHLSAQVPDIKAARAYVDEQRHYLEERARFAVDSIKHRLFFYGFRPVVTRSEFPGNTETEYQCREDLRDHISAAEATARETAWAARDAYNEAASQPEFVEHDEYTKLREAELQATALSRAAWQLGQQHLDCWAIPGTETVIHVGTRGPRRGYDAIECTHSIVIKPGRAPSEYELDQLVAEAIAAVTGDDTLKLAA